MRFPATIEDICSPRAPFSSAGAPGRLITSRDIRISEIISALSAALDITQGHPEGHCLRSALIGMRLAELVRLPRADYSALFYALLLKDLGCSSNAAKMTHLFGADDRALKRATRLIDWTNPVTCLKHCWTQSAPGGGPLDKLLRVVAVARQGAEGARKISEIRCTRGADIAKMMDLPDATATAIRQLDEHWNGQGTPQGLQGTEISLLARICCLAQTVEVFATTIGPSAALDIARDRRGSWFDPDLVDALLTLRNNADFWRQLRVEDLIHELAAWEPEDAVLHCDEALLDRISAAFAQVVDAKSPWTFQHSSRVAEIVAALARQFDCPPGLQADLRRAGWLHDLGKLGVSNQILDKPGKPTDEEFAEIRKHPDYSQHILARVDAFQTLAEVAGSHHERLDGRGYHRQLPETEIPWVTRILTVADVYEAMSARRPYRDALPWEKIYDILARDVGRGVDGDCLAALATWHEGQQLESRVDAQLDEVERLQAEWGTIA